MTLLKQLLNECPAEIKKMFQPVSLKKKDIIFSQGEVPKHVYIFINGRVNVYRLALNGINYLEYIYTDYGLIGEVEVILEREMLCYVTVESEKCDLFKLDIEFFKKWLKMDSHFNSYVLFHIAEKIYDACISNEVNIAYPMKYKVMFYLKNQADKKNIYISKEDVLAAIGGKMRSLNRIINELIEDKILEYDSNVIKIINLDILIEEMKKFEKR